MSAYNETPKKITAPQLTLMKQKGEKIAMLTAYDYTTALIVDGAGVDIILVGDSAANVMAGHATTLPITLDQMIYHAAAVSRAANRALVVCDMPFGTYLNADEGVHNAVRIMQESGCDGVKLEGGAEVAETIRRITTAGIPVIGHLGLTPQSVHRFGGYGLRAKEEAEAAKLIADAQKLQEAGCSAIVLEKIPSKLAGEVTAALDIPTIGIGGGVDCDGQVLVIDDMLGKNKGFRPKFLRVYADLHGVMTTAIGNYVSDVKSGDFPSAEEQY